MNDTSMFVLGGGHIDLDDPKPDQISLTAIAFGLAKKCRFAGQIQGWYSVAEHSVACVELARKSGHDDLVQQAMLFHDAAEAYIGDNIRPLRRAEGWRSIGTEKRLQVAIHEKYGIDLKWIEHTIVRDIDDAMLIAELRFFRPNDWHTQEFVTQTVLSLADTASDIVELATRRKDLPPHFDEIAERWFEYAKSFDIED